MTSILRSGFLVAVLLAAGACSDDSSTTPEPASEATVFFNLNVGGAPLQLSTSAQTYTSPAGTKYGIKELRFIVSDVTLHSDDGKSVLLKGVHYYDINDPATQTIHVASLPHADYTGVSFTFGLDASKNVRGKYPAIPNIMEWPTGLGADLGYHYMQLEGNYEQTPGGATGGYTTHTGGRHLDTDVTAYHFDFPVNLTFTPTHIHEGEHGELVVAFDLNGWYMDHTPADGVDTQYDFTTLPSQMIMGDLDAQGKLQANGPGCFAATLTVEGGQDH